MRPVLHITAALLLLFTGTGALYSGWNLIISPEGGLPVSLVWLQNTWFQQYPIPGIIILVVSGVFSLFTLAAIVLDLRSYALLIISQGTIPLGWMILQVILTNRLEPAHVVLGLIGAILVFVGWKLSHEKLQYDANRR
jgi:hypothetical protein